jgi:hypothetical protein
VTPALLRVRQRGSELGTALQGIVALARVDLDKFINDVEALSLGKVNQRRTLRFENLDLNDFAYTSSIPT